MSDESKAAFTRADAGVSKYPALIMGATMAGLCFVRPARRSTP